MVIQVVEKDEYTITELSDILDVHRTTVWQWIKDGLVIGRRKGIGKKSPYAISKASLVSIAAQMDIQIDFN